LLHVCVGNVLTILHICLAVHLRCISGAPGQQYLISLGKFCGNAAKEFCGTSVMRLAANFLFTNNVAYTRLEAIFNETQTDDL